MSMKDVRGFLMKQLAELADSDATPEEMATVIDRAKATASVAGTYCESVKLEMEAIRLLDETGRLPEGIEIQEIKRLGK